MMPIVVLAFLMQAGAAARVNEPSPNRMPMALVDAANAASGHSLCDAGEKRRQERLFDHRYGARVLRLAAAMEQRDGGLGWLQDENFVYVMPCRTMRPSDLSRALDQFEQSLRALEIRYGSAR